MHLAAALVEAGHQVVLAGRTPFDQLIVKHLDGEVATRLNFVTSARDLCPSGLVLLATKAHQTPAAADLIRASCGPGTVLAVLQNGIGQDARVRPYLDQTGPPNSVDVLTVMVACPADRNAPGRFTVNGRAAFEVQMSAAGQQFSSAFSGSFAKVRTVDDMHTLLWRKLLMNAVGGGIGVLTRRSNEVFTSDGDSLVLAHALALEVLAVARADGANLDDEAVAAVLTTLQRGSTHLPSIVVDRLNGQPTEWDIRNHIVGKKGIEHGVATPLNHMLSTLIRLGEPLSK